MFGEIGKAAVSNAIGIRLTASPSGVDISFIRVLCSPVKL